MRHRSIVAALAVALVLTGRLSAQLVFDDGGDHMLTGVVNDAVYVSNQSHLTIDASSFLADVHVSNATVDYLNPNNHGSNQRFTITDHSVFNSRQLSRGLYSIVDSEANFYAGLNLDGDALNASGASIVQLLGGGYWETTSERIRVRGDAQIFVSSEAEVYVPIFMHDSARGEANDARIASLVLKDSSTFDVYGGILSDASSDDNWSDRSLRLFDDAKFTMTGGTINSWYDSFSPMIKTHQRSQVVLRDVQNGDGVHYQFWGGNDGVALFHSTGESLIQIDSGQFRVHLTDIPGLICGGPQCLDNSRG